MKSLRKQVRDFFIENGNYKIVAFFIAFVLWGTVLARRDVIYIRTVDINFLVAEDQVLTSDIINQIEVRLAGSRIALKRFSQRNLGPIQVDLTNVGLGARTVSIPEESLRLPTGIRVVSMAPQTVMVNLAPAAPKVVKVKVVDLPTSLKADSDWMEVVPADVNVKGIPGALDTLVEIEIEKIAWTQALEKLWIGTKKGQIIEIPVRLKTPRGIQVVGLRSEGRVLLRLRKKSE